MDMNAVKFPVYLPCFINIMGYSIWETNKFNRDSDVYWQM